MKLKLNSRPGLAVLVVGVVLAIVGLAVGLAFAFNNDDATDASPTESVPVTDQPDPTITPVDRAADTDVATLVGMTLADAEAWAGSRGLTIRPVKIDGEDLAVTKDYREDRINVEVNNGIVIAVQGIG